MKLEGDQKDLQHQVPQISKQQSNHQDKQGDDWRIRRGIILICKCVGFFFFFWSFLNPIFRIAFLMLYSFHPIYFLIYYKVFQINCNKS